MEGFLSRGFNVYTSVALTSGIMRSIEEVILLAKFSLSREVVKELQETYPGSVHICDKLGIPRQMTSVRPSSSEAWKQSLTRSGSQTEAKTKHSILDKVSGNSRRVFAGDGYTK